MNSKLKSLMYILRNTLITICLLVFQKDIIANELTIAKVIVNEPSGISRAVEYVELQIQLKIDELKGDNLNIVAEDYENNQIIPCQIFNKHDFPDENITLLNLVFPISIEANGQKIFLLKSVESKTTVNTDLKLVGEGLDIKIDNDFYRADLSKSNKSEAKSHNSGQLNELKIKMDFDQLLYRTENRMHWAPNFQKEGLEYYKTIAGWENPQTYQLNHGPYLASTHRQDYAPNHAEILLTANYYFYAGLPYFKFFSSMNIVKDISLFLLRNDEMTMDSLFTHVAYQNNSGEILDMTFSDRHTKLKKNPIQNNSPCQCFYNEIKGYAFGSIRIKYDNTNKSGLTSPTYLPHTKISNGANGGKYWNRLLINEKLTFVPSGSFYVEENAYLVFRISRENKFKEILDWTNKVTNPVVVTILPEE